MFRLVKKRDILIRKFHDGAEWLSRELNKRGHTLDIDREIERFEREVVEPLDKEFSKQKGTTAV
ncbi:MAG: hypothetical protein EOM12_09000 [Verrucomicrobiae bacterium]|nr:hypothetical protein [Verrucomicrobiae bacterium]